MDTNSASGTTQEDLTFRPGKKYFVFYIILSILLMFVLIGFIMLIAIILWYKFTYITLTKQGIHMHKGWLNVTDKQVPYEKVNTIETKQSIIDRMLGCGQLKIFTGNDIQGITFVGIDNPQKIKTIIEQRVNESLTREHMPANHASQSSAADELTKFAKLRQSGAITQEEFDTKKRQILG